MAEPDIQPLAGQLKPGKPTITYPTPDIDDLFIIEMVDTNAGNYQSLEYGTNYPDQIKFQGFKLVYQEPVNWKYIKRIWTADRTRESQDEYNLTVEYPWSDLNYPRAMRTYVFPRSDYEPRAIETAETTGLGVLVNTQRNPIQDPTLNSLYISITEIYDTIPPFNNGVTARRQEFQAPSEFLTTGQVNTTTVIGSGQSLSSLGTDGVGVVSTSLQTVDALHNNLTNEVDTATIQSTVTSTFVDESTQQTTGTLTSQYGSGLSASAPAFLQLSSRVTNLRADRQRKDTVTVAAWPVLHGTVVDEVTGIAVAIQKTFVPNGTVGGKVGNNYTEIQPYDAVKSISITSTVIEEDLPEDLEIPGTDEVSFPDELISITGAWDSSTGVSGSAGTSTAGGQTHAVVDGTPVLKIKPGYRGPAKSWITRTYSNEQPTIDDIPTPTFIRGSIGTVYVLSKNTDYGAQVGESSSGSIQGNVRVRAMTIGPILTNNFTSGNLTSNAVAGPLSINAEGSAGIVPQAVAVGTITIAINQSTPVTLVPGSTIISKVSVIQGRLGIWITEVLRVVIPTPP